MLEIQNMFLRQFYVILEQVHNMGIMLLCRMVFVMMIS